MATTYDDVLQSVRQLLPEEHRQLREELAHLDEQSTNAPLSPFVLFLENAEPIRPEALDAMECAIEEDLEVIDPRDI